jgi:uncharacterized membrane protein
LIGVRWHLFQELNRNEKSHLSMGFIISTIVITVYGQMIVKWRLGQAGSLPAGLSNRAAYFGRLLYDPWIISVLLVTPLAALCWFAAMTKYDLSYAYPFMSLAFVIVLILSAIFLHEPVTVPKVLGVVLVTVGLIIASQG